jgi:hypothetical protein
MTVIAVLVLVVAVLVVAVVTGGVSSGGVLTRRRVLLSGGHGRRIAVSAGTLVCVSWSSLPRTKWSEWNSASSTSRATWALSAA